MVKWFNALTKIRSDHTGRNLPDKIQSETQLPDNQLKLVGVDRTSSWNSSSSNQLTIIFQSISHLPHVIISSFFLSISSNKTAFSSRKNLGNFYARSPFFPASCASLTSEPGLGDGTLDLEVARGWNIQRLESLMIFPWTPLFVDFTRDFPWISQVLIWSSQHPLLLQ
jgi:hypothetical protein